MAHKAKALNTDINISPVLSTARILLLAVLQLATSPTSNEQENNLP